MLAGGSRISGGQIPPGLRSRASIARPGAKALHEIDEEEGIDFDQK
jgi:hypothetical protein